MESLTIEGLGKAFGATVALDGVDLAVEPGEFFCVVGPTNAGKSTLLKAVAGLHRPDRGRIAIAGRDVTSAPPHLHNVSLLFQNAALFPTLTGFENIAFPLRIAGMTSARVEAAVGAMAALLKIEPVLDRLPRTFSGGEQQRVAIARALVRPGSVLMLDEPLTNLDARLRIALRIEFKKLHRESGQTIVYVTHDQVEAMSLSDRIAVLDRGRVQQVGSPDDIYHRPVNRFVAQFVGSPPMNIVAAELVESDSLLRLAGRGFSAPLPASSDPALLVRLPRRLAFGIRPERIAVAPAPSEETPFAAEVTWVEHLGNKSVLALRLGDALLKATVRQDRRFEGRGPVWIGFRIAPEHLLDPETGRFLRHAID